MEAKNLQLPLIGKWFKMTDAEIKTEEYREITPFWAARFLLWKGKPQRKKFWEEKIINPSFLNLSYFVTSKPFTHNIMTLGYPHASNKDRIATFEHAGIEIREGNPDWGAEQGKLYIVIKHGK